MTAAYVWFGRDIVGMVEVATDLRAHERIYFPHAFPPYREYPIIRMTEGRFGLVAKTAEDLDFLKNLSSWKEPAP